MGRYLLIGVLASTLLFCQAVVVYASYRGWGTTSTVQGRSVRSGSIFGPSVTGGGPGDGK
jgi:hypothetical protein